MNKLRSVIVGLGLIAGTTLSANNAFSAFYPPIEEDTPDYVLEKEVKLDSSKSNVLVNTSIAEDVIEVFYPEKNDDTPDYLKSDF